MLQRGKGAGMMMSELKRGRARELDDAGRFRNRNRKECGNLDVATQRGINQLRKRIVATTCPFLIGIHVAR
jgi:hypothetical protein